MRAETHKVVQYTKDGKFVAVMSGMGRNAGKLDSNHGRSAAYHHAATLRKEDLNHVYKVEEN